MSEVHKYPFLGDLGQNTIKDTNLFAQRSHKKHLNSGTAGTLTAAVSFPGQSLGFPAWSCRCLLDDLLKALDRLVAFDIFLGLGRWRVYGAGW